MPKKTDPPMTQAEQSRRFEETARAIEADGGLSPTEAAEAFERLVRERPRLANSSQSNYNKDAKEKD